MTDAEDLPIRPATAGDEARLVDLFASVYGRSIDVSHWRWKLAHPQATVPNVWLVMSGERPVFQYAGIPTTLRIDGAAVTGMVSVDTMTAPDFRRRGLLTRVATQVYAQWGDAGMAFVMGLPNEKWGSRTSAVGLRPLFPFRWLARPLRPEALLAHRLSIPWLRRLSFVSALWSWATSLPGRPDASVQVRPVDRAGVEFDDLWERCKDDARFGVVRDRRWVQWRFLDCPSRRYEVRLALRGTEPVGYCAYHVHEAGGRRSAFLAELACARGDMGARDALLADLIRQLPGVELLWTQAAPGTHTYRWLRRRAFFVGHEFSVQMAPFSPHLPIDDMARPEHWELSGAAFDVI